MDSLALAKRLCSRLNRLKGAEDPPDRSPFYYVGIRRFRRSHYRFRFLLGLFCRATAASTASVVMRPNYSFNATVMYRYENPAPDAVRQLKH